MKIKFLFILLLSLSNIKALNIDLNTGQKKQKIIILNPSGHAKKLGRKLSQGYERGETLKFAENLQKVLYENYNLKVFISRQPGKETLEYQPASLSNRINTDLFVSIHICKERSEKPKVSIFQQTYNPTSDFAKRDFNPTLFIPIHQSHLKNIHQTKSIVNNLKESLTTKECKKLFDFSGPSGIPLKPLVGITCPAIAMEICVSQDNKWKGFIEKIAEGIYNSI